MIAFAPAQNSASGLLGSRLPLPTTVEGRVARLRAMSLRGLRRMFDPSRQTFVFRLRKTREGVIPEGSSVRYTAISLIGLSTATRDEVASVLGTSGEAVYGPLAAAACASTNVGDVALTLWAGDLLGFETAAVRQRLFALRPEETVQPSVEIAWALTAMSRYADDAAQPLAQALAARLREAFSARSRLFPHVCGEKLGHRSHVSCFADLIYPIQALSIYAESRGDAAALRTATEAAMHLCELQGDAGQWWWHYDYRTGRVLEKYPVYAIHQDAMGPMGLFALRNAGGPDVTANVVRGLDWLEQAPELNGGSLVDEQEDLIWRKVARSEPRKAVRYAQAAAARVHPSWRVPLVDVAFPARAIDFEDRPYHLGWLLYAWDAAARGQR